MSIPIPLSITTRFDAWLNRLQRKLPRRFALFLVRLRQPHRTWIRVPVAFGFMVGGVLSFLPILGFWMLPLGLMLLAQDVPPLQRPLVAALDWADRVWPKAWH